MRSEARSASQPDAGFSLIELLMVTVLVGILATLVIPIYLEQRDKVAGAAVKSDLRNAASEIEASISDGTSYADASLADHNGSSGITVTLTSRSDETYCLDGTSVHTDAVFHYDPAAGGLLDGSCAAAGSG